MGDRSSDASALLGMDGFVVLSQIEEDGELYVLVETTATVAGRRGFTPGRGRATTGGSARCRWTRVLRAHWIDGGDRCRVAGGGGGACARGRASGHDDEPAADDRPGRPDGFIPHKLN